MMLPTPHYDKLRAALKNEKCRADIPLLNEAIELYRGWTAGMDALISTGQERVADLVRLFNAYKDVLEVELIMKRGSDFLRRQKGQLKLDNSALEEFLIHLIRPEILPGIGATPLLTGPRNAFMSLSFRPRGLSSLDQKPEVVIKSKDQDFVIGTELHYQFSPTHDFAASLTTGGSLVLAVVAAECKVNLDKTMYQEAAGTAARLKQGCPVAKYFVLAEYLDMEPEDSRLTDIDNVFLLRHARRLPQDQRNVIVAVERQHSEHPIDAAIIWRFVQLLQEFVDARWYDPTHALQRGSFV